jgi:hypothetical protein
LAASLHPEGVPGHDKEVTDMGYIIAWLLGVPVTLLVLVWLSFAR